jgi:TonB family protein
LHARLITLAFLLSLVGAATAQADKPSDQQACEVPANPGSGISPPRIINSPGPEFPHGADADRREKLVVLSTIIGTNGKACGPEIKQSPGPEFDRAALNALRDWKWKPAMKSGKPVAVRIFVEMHFRKE